MNAATTFRKAVTTFLGIRRPDLLAGLKQAEWQRNLRWLDRSGLALPLASCLEKGNSEIPIPPEVADALLLRLADNEKRMESILCIFRETLSALNAAEVRYCCVKGFTLIPECFHHIRERHQVDLDFLIDPGDVKRAVSAMETAGYPLLEARSSGELRFSRPRKKHLGVNAWLYQMPETISIELHTQVWEPEPGAVNLTPPENFLNHTVPHEVSGVSLQCLSPSYQFVYLVLHIFRHLASSWVRLLSVYEVSMLLRKWQAEKDRWEEISVLMESNQNLSSACALIIEIARRIFDVEPPQLLAEFCRRSLSAESTRWLGRHLESWAFTDPPGNKLALLVQGQFFHDRSIWHQYLLQRLFPRHKTPLLSEDADPATKESLSFRMEDLLYKADRAWYHFHSNYQYLMAQLQRQTAERRRQQIPDRFAGGV
ncbi:nucleotidyltransferase family protein [Paracidobacterium acidisoli]|uniref:Nucleotidyltransferase family protein n=1 Tax=Paracidobacterium acidisoli TaxID=2303751 RepID=A0A372ILE2_9BACT|nr:nucleotidyltransferase family protein [Paracidobacterium acidisoli]MBT9332358.1 nucleotidyltransferase family protein [Paracidobacterium acidisoli]